MMYEKDLGILVEVYAANQKGQQLIHRPKRGEGAACTRLFRADYLSKFHGGYVLTERGWKFVELVLVMIEKY